MDSKISIIVPCYNQARYLDDCLQSVLDQTYQNWECIIVNDGSPDNTAEVAEKWTQKDARFRYIFKENGGLSSARNAGIEVAKGEWILPLDSDDRIGNQYIELAEKEFINEYQIIYCRANFFGHIYESWNLEYTDFNQLLCENLIFCSAFFKRISWSEAGGYDTGLIYGREDWEFWINILSKSNRKVKQLDYVGFFYRRKEDSMDVKINKDISKIRHAENYVFEKHKSLYYEKLGSIQQLMKISHKNMLENVNLKRKNDALLNAIRKNVFTKFLFKLIEKM